MKIAVLIENTSEYGRRLVDGIAAYAREARGWRLVWINPDEKFSPKSLDGCAGVIARTANDVIARRLVRTGLPVVDVFCQKSYPGFCGVNSNHDKIGKLAAVHFLAKRHVNFAFVGFRNVSFSAKRRKAFESALGGHGYKVSTLNIPLKRDQRVFFNTKITPLANRELLRPWLSKLPRPVAVFAANDLLALNITRIASDIGMDIPRDIAVLGVDDDRLICAFAETPISSIDPNAYGIGLAAARALAAMIRRPPKKKSHPVYHISPNGIVERASTERHAVKPDWLADALGFIEASIDRPLSTAELVKFTGRSHVTLTKTFGAKLGMSPLRYITDVKMKAARTMLCEGGHLVKEVASCVGYPSVTRFSVVYKAYWNRTPRDDARR